MALTDHISDEIFDRYAARNSTAAETLAVQTHIAACESCRAKLAQIVDAEKAFAAIHSDLVFDDSTDEPEHLAYERLESFLDGKLDAVDREIAESHLAFCAECSEDLADLQTYREIAHAPAATNLQTAETERKSFWQKLFAFDSIGSFAPVAAVLLIAVLFGAWFLIRFNRTNEELAQTNTNQITPAPTASLPSNVNANSVNSNQTPEANAQNNQTVESPVEKPETLLALNDGQITVDQNGTINGLENLSAAAQKAVRQSVQSGKVSVSPSANSLGGSGGILMGGGNESSGVPFALQTPVGKVIREAQPVLRWKPLKDATAYSVAIVDDKFRVVAESGKLNATNWKPSKSLPRGANYSWQVTATLPDGTETVSPSAPAPQARFRVIEQLSFDEISRLEKAPSRSHLALGILYANAGLKQEARRELQTLLKQNPNSALARKLLASLR